MTFQFKQFDIIQEKSAMKVGTDGVLLGAWTSIKNNPYSILDIGTGTGLIALQLAQRSDAETIDAIEIDSNAFEEAMLNFENSKWNNRLYCYHASLKEFIDEIDEKYDLIVSNPPFYKENYQSNDPSRNKARFTSSLPFNELIKSVSLLLSENGMFSVIIPYKEEVNFIKIANEYSLYPNHICHVKGNINTEIKRSLISFTFNKAKVNMKELIIEIDRHKYTSDYKNIVNDFYLKM